MTTFTNKKNQSLDIIQKEIILERKKNVKLENESERLREELAELTKKMESLEKENNENLEKLRKKKTEDKNTFSVGDFNPENWPKFNADILLN